MKRTFVATFILFCAVVLISQWRRPHAGGNPTQDLAQQSEQMPQTEHPFPSPRPIRSPFTTVARSRSASIPTIALPERILVEWNGHWYPAEIVQSAGNRHLIRYTGYGDEWNEWVGPDRIRDAALPASLPEVAANDEQQRLQPQAGDFVVKWNDRWWRAQPLLQSNEQTLIRYVGYGAEWDEWVTPDRAKVFTEADAAANAVTESEPTRLVDLDGLDVPAPSSAKFLVEWSGRWWPADVLAEQEGKYFIHYEGYGNNWDEWIAPERLRVPEQPPK